MRVAGDQQPVTRLHRGQAPGHELCQTCGRPVGDEVTGLDDRWTWARLAPVLLMRARTRTCGAAVLVIDIDRFKKVNDAYGHPAGDAVLVAVADQLRAVTRPDEHDLVCRAGSRADEFLVLLFAVDRHKAVSIAGQLRAHVAAMAVPVPTGDGTRVVTGLSVSIGVALYDPTLDTDLVPDLDAFVQAADSAELHAKHAGGGIWVHPAANPRR